MEASLEHLLAVTVSGFPTLDDDPTDRREVEQTLDAVRHWAELVRDAHGILATEEAGVDFEDPVPVMVWFRGGVLSTGLSIIPLIDCASDVLGELPKEFASCHANALCKLCTVMDGKIRRPFLTSRIEVIPQNWSVIRDDVLSVRMLTIVQMKRLVAWARERIGALRSALIPKIRHVGSRSHHRVEVEVSSAGIARSVILTDAQATLLKKLLERGEACDYRRVKHDLVQAIPELESFIFTSRRTVSDPNKAVYGLPEDVRNTVLSGPPAK